MVEKSDVTVWPTSYCAAFELTNFLCRLSDSELAQAICILPTERLAVNVLAAMSEYKKSFVPPKMVSIDSFVDLACQLLGIKIDAEPVDELAEEFLIAGIIRAGSFKHIVVGHEHELKQLFASVNESELSEKAFEKLCETIKYDVYRSNQHTDSLLARAEEILLIYKQYQNLQSKHGFLSVDIYRAKQINQLCQKLTQTQTGFWSYLIWCGFTTLKPYYLPLLQSLLSLDRVRFWLSHPPDLLNNINPLLELIQGVGQKFVTTKQKANAKVNIRRCKNLYSEVACALELASEHIKKGISPCQIGILVTSEAEYSGAFRALLPSFAYSHNIACTARFNESSLGIWLTSMINFLLVGDGFTDFWAWISHKISVKWWQNTSELKDLSVRGLHSLILESSTASDFDKLISSATDERLSILLIKVNKIFTDWRVKSQRSHAKQSLSKWCRSFHDFLLQFNIFEYTENHTEQGIDSSSVNTVLLLLASLQRVSEVLNHKLSLQEFLHLLRDKLLGQEIRSIGYPLKGVQILSLSESRYIPFQVVIIVGCVEGKFPKALPSDHLIDDWLKQKMGLRGWQYIEALEDTTFQLLYHRIPHLELLYPETLSDVISVRSRFLERLIGEGIAKEICEDSLVPLINLLSVESSHDSFEICANQRKNEVIGYFPYKTKPMLNEISATTLNYLLTCPYRFMLTKLGIVDQPLINESSPKEEGILLHGICEAFFTGYGLKQKVDYPMPDLIAADSLYDYFLERINNITDKLLPKSLHQSPLHMHLRYYSWPKLCKFLTQFYEIETSTQLTHWKALAKNRYQEFSLGGESGHVAKILLTSSDGRSDLISIRGSIDQIDVFNHGYVLTDYKRRTSSNADQSNSFQLILYALAMASLLEKNKSLQSQSGLVGYWSILDGAWEPLAVGQKLREWAQELNLINSNTKNLDEQIRELKNEWAKRHFELLRDETVFSPQPGKYCEKCSFLGLCRFDDVTSLQKTALEWEPVDV